MVKIILIICFLFFSPINTAFAVNFGQMIGDVARSEANRRDRENYSLEKGKWDSADFIREERTGDYSILRCHYKTLNGFEFSVNIRNRGCPYRVYINPETNQVQITR